MTITLSQQKINKNKTDNQRWARATSKVAPLPLLALKSSVAIATRLQK